MIHPTGEKQLERATRRAGVQVQRERFRFNTEAQREAHPIEQTLLTFVGPVHLAPATAGTSRSGNERGDRQGPPDSNGINRSVNLLDCHDPPALDVTAESHGGDTTVRRRAALTSPIEPEQTLSVTKPLDDDPATGGTVDAQVGRPFGDRSRHPAILAAGSSGAPVTPSA